MKKFFKFLFVLIALASMAGCAYFGYYYFKDRNFSGNMSISTAKELVYTAAYDLNAITKLEFNDEIGKEPIVKPANYNDTWGAGNGVVDTTNELEVYNDYTSDEIYFKVDDHISEYESSFRVNYLKIISELFKNDVKENIYYSKQIDDTNYKFYFDISGDVLTFRLVDGSTSSSIITYSANEMVYEFTLGDKNESGILDYSLLIKSFKASETEYSSSSYLFVIGFDVSANQDVKQLDRMYVAWTISDIAYKTTTDLNSLNGSLFTRAYDCNIKTNKILYLVSDNSTVNTKVANTIKDDIHINVAEFYADKEFTIL